MKKIFLAAIIAVFTLVNVSTSNADLVLDFNGGSVTQSDGTIINYTVTRTNGTLTGVPAEGIFEADETDDDTRLRTPSFSVRSLTSLFHLLQDQAT